MSATAIVPDVDVAYLDRELLAGDGRIRLLPAAAYASIDPLHLRLWCHHRARYCIPTLELVAWLKAHIGPDRYAIEIGSGNGDLAYHLGIAATDSYQQLEDPRTVAYYRALDAPPTRPTVDVFKLDAQLAVDAFRPDVVIGAWVTQSWTEADPGAAGNYLGVDEGLLLARLAARGGSYIHVGNDAIHAHKRICARWHDRFRFDWLVSRATRPDLNAIYVWDIPAHTPAKGATP